MPRVIVNIFPSNPSYSQIYVMHACITQAAEHLEAAFARDAISQEEVSESIVNTGSIHAHWCSVSLTQYTIACGKVISQFKTTEAALIQAGTITDTK